MYDQIKDNLMCRFSPLPRWTSLDFYMNAAGAFHGRLHTAKERLQLFVRIPFRHSVVRETK